MNTRPSTWRSFALVASLALIATWLPLQASAAVAASDRLKSYDGTTASAFLDGNVQLYAAPVNGKYGAPQTYRAQLLFARPDRFRLVLRPGTKEYRVVASAGTVQWRDYATGLSGQGKTVDLIDSAAFDMLRMVGELARYNRVQELSMSPNSPLRGAVLRPVSYRSQVLRAVAWFRNDQPHLFEIQYHDGRKLYFAVSSFQHNPTVKPGDFVL